MVKDVAYALGQTVFYIAFILPVMVWLGIMWWNWWFPNLGIAL